MESVHAESAIITFALQPAVDASLFVTQTTVLLSRSDFARVKSLIVGWARDTPGAAVAPVFLAEVNRIHRLVTIHGVFSVDVCAVDTASLMATPSFNVCPFIVSADVEVVRLADIASARKILNYGIQDSSLVKDVLQRADGSLELFVRGLHVVVFGGERHVTTTLQLSAFVVNDTVTPCG